MKFIFQMSILLFSCMILCAQDTARHNISGLSFMTGRWTGSMEWGDLEETWSEPMGNCMTCSFRCVKDGKVVFYEFIVIEQMADSAPVMKLRHFSPGSIAWEDKTSPYLYPLVSLQSEMARFESSNKKTAMAFQRVAKNKMKVTLEREENGKWKIDVFNYTLASR